MVELQVNVPRGSIYVTLALLQERGRYVLYAGRQAPSVTRSIVLASIIAPLC